MYKKILISVKTWNGEKSYVDREAEQDKINGVKRSFDDEYNEDFDRGVVSILIDKSLLINTYITFIYLIVICITVIRNVRYNLEYCKICHN